MSWVWRTTLRLLTWGVVAVLLVEVFSFHVISASNYLMHGHFREGSAVRYDPYALFLHPLETRPTAHNPPPGRERGLPVVWLLGGSTMRGSTDFHERTIPSYMAGQLNGTAAGPRAVFHNFGVISFNSLMETKYLQKLLIERPSPDLVIFYDGANDASYFAQHRRSGAHHGYRQVQGLIESYHRSFFGLLKPLHAAFYASFTRELLDKLHQVVVPLPAEVPELKEFVDSVEQRYDYLDRLARACGFRFLLFWQPVWWLETGPVRADLKAREEAAMVGRRLTAVRHNFAVIYKALAARLQSKPYFINLQNVLTDRTGPVYRSDGVHLNDAGRERVAREVAQVLRNKFPAWFPQPRQGR